jgi:peptidoglycan/xylan/chitin deacetylase (PgdA/CDA1 family)
MRNIHEGANTVKTLSQRDGNPEKIRVLFYHRIGSEADARISADITISQRTFRIHLTLLEKWGYTPITFQDFELYRTGELSLPKKPVVITFDDGYQDLYTYAFPVMKEFGMRGVIFVVGDRQMRTNEWDEGFYATYPLLNDEEILEFHEAGFEIGAHSMHHFRLTEMTADEAWEELHQARIATEILLNAPVLTFSYPYGLVNSELKKMASDAGYSVACAAFTGPPVFGSDLLEVRRIKMTDSRNPIVFWFQLQSLYVHYRWIWWRMQKVFGAIAQRAHGIVHGHPHPLPLQGRHHGQRERMHIVKSEETHS